MRSTIDIESLRLFRAVVEAESFTAAGVLLEKDKAYVSRVISRLEKRLGAQLLWRSTRRLAITEVGKEFYERAVSILNALEDTENVIAQTQSEPVGHLRITCGTEFGVMRVNHWIAQYMKKYPSVKIEAEYTNRVVDIIHEGFDVAIRVGPLPDSDLSARTLGYVEYGLYASPQYLTANGTPQTPHELEQHNLIMFSPRGKPKWILVNDKDRVEIDSEPQFRVNNNLAARDIAAEHLGIVLLPHFQAAPLVKERRLTHVLTDWSRSPVAVSAVFSSSRYMTPKVRSFIDLIKSEWA